jgi:hypothetical protein
MNRAARPPRRLRIDRIELRLRGVAPPVAEEMARRLESALSRAFAGQAATVQPASAIDAGRIDTGATPDPDSLANGVAGRVARSLQGTRS